MCQLDESRLAVFAKRRYIRTRIQPPLEYIKVHSASCIYNRLQDTVLDAMRLSKGYAHQVYIIFS